jgi:hypothetical protein
MLSLFLCVAMPAGVTSAQSSASPAYSATSPMAAAYSVLRTPPCFNISVATCCVMPAGVTDTQGGGSAAYLSATNPASLLFIMPSLIACCHCLQV